MRLVKKSQIPDFEVYVDGKKDEKLTVKAKKALEFINRYDEVAGNQLSILDWDSKLQNYYFKSCFTILFKGLYFRPEMVFNRLKLF